MPNLFMDGLGVDLVAVPCSISCVDTQLLLAVEADDIDIIDEIAGKREEIFGTGKPPSRAAAMAGLKRVIAVEETSR